MDLRFSLLRLTEKVQGWQCVPGPEECHTVTAVCAPQHGPKRFACLQMQHLPLQVQWTRWPRVSSLHELCAASKLRRSPAINEG